MLAIYIYKELKIQKDVGEDDEGTSISRWI